MPPPVPEEATPPLIVALFRVRLPPLPTARIRKSGEPGARLMVWPLPSMVMALVITGKPLAPPRVELFTAVRVTAVARLMVSAPLPAAQSACVAALVGVDDRLRQGTPIASGDHAGAVGHRDEHCRAGAGWRAVHGQQQRDPGQAQAKLALPPPPLGPRPAAQPLVPGGEAPEQVGPERRTAAAQGRGLGDFGQGLLPGRHGVRLPCAVLDFLHGVTPRDVGFLPRAVYAEPAIAQVARR